MSVNTITFKLVVEKDHKDTGDIRRLTLSEPVRYRTLVEAAKDLLQADEFKIRYVDDDGDRIVLSSQYELDTAIGLCGSKNIVRLYVEILKEKDVSQKPVEEEPVDVDPQGNESDLEELMRILDVEEEKPVVEEKKPVVEEKKPVVEEKKPEPVPEPAAVPAAEDHAPESEKKEGDALPFAELFRMFAGVPGVNCSQNPSNGDNVVDIDLNKLFSSENGQNMFAKLNDLMTGVCKTVDEQRKAHEAAVAEVMKPDESAGVYSHVIHTMPTTVVHRGVVCDGCGKHDICGMRYKCAQCPDYDLCQFCIRRAGAIHDPSHMFYPITFPRFRRGGCGCGMRPFCFANCMHHPQPQPQPQPEAKPEAKPEPKPEVKPQPEPEPKVEPKVEPQPIRVQPAEPKVEAVVETEAKPKKDELLDERYASLHMTPAEMQSVHVLMEMGFPDVEVDLYYLRYYGGVINDALVETLVQRRE